jgi:hypothetical protein
VNANRAAETPNAPQAASAPLATTNYYVIGSLLTPHCVECGAPLTSNYGKFSCTLCNTVYMIKRIDCVAGIMPASNLQLHTTHYKNVQIVKAARSYTPRLRDRVITYDDPFTTAERAAVDADISDVDLNATVCCICCKPLSAVMSVRVMRTRFRDVELFKTHPVSGNTYTEVKSAPSYKVGRAHSECALANPRDCKMVDVRPVPSKTERISTADRMGDYFRDKWVEVPDVIDLDDA